MSARALSEKQVRVIDRHMRVAGLTEKGRVAQWEGAYSVFDPKTGRLYVHKNDRQSSAYQSWVFESADGVASTLTASRNIKFWDLRRDATGRELARIQGFPEYFSLPASHVVALFGRAVSVPVATHALRSTTCGASPRTFVDICAGIGGFHVAAHALGLECVGFSEVNPAAVACYTANFPESPQLGCLYAAFWPSCDVVCCGFPCQPFSRSMQTIDRAVHADCNMCHALPNILDATRASFVVIENVRSLLTLGKAQLEFLCSALKSRGFHVAWQVLDSCDFGLPQTRKRLYLIARKDREPSFHHIAPRRTVLRDVLE